VGSVVSYSILDATGEKSNFRLYGPALTGATYDAQLAEVSGIRTALGGITAGTVSKEDVLASSELISSNPASEPYAQRELKLLVLYHGNTTQKAFTFTVPCPDLDALTRSGGSDAIVLTDAGVMAAFVTAVQGFATSPDDDTESITIDSARIVGRNL
jgi:hypothetical protein